MRDAYRSLLTVLGAVLALWLILGFWPLSTSSRVALSLLIVLVTGVMFWRQRRAFQARVTAVRDIVDENLPPEDFQGAIVLACGDNAQLFVSGTRRRETRQSWYLRVKDAEQLPLFAQHLSQARSALVPQISVMLAVIPEQHTSGDDFTQFLRGWQRAVVQCRAAFGRIPPLWTVTWVSPFAACSEAEPVWFTTVSQRAGIQVYQPGLGNVSLAEWAREIGLDGRHSHLSQGLWLDSLLTWQNRAVNDLLSVRQGELPVMMPCVQGMCMVPVSGIAGNLWQQHIASVTALPPDMATTTEPLPLPELLLLALPRRRGVSSRMVFWRYAGILGWIFLVLAMLASWMNNQRLIRNVGDHLALYHQLTGNPVAPKLRAQQRLRADGALLDDWQRRGEPLRYRLGLYITYARKLTEQVQALWPKEAKPLVQQWQQQLNASTLPAEQLNSWNLGMITLQKLSDRLNGLDEQKGKYMTVSELKSAVFSIRQSFNQSIPAEEQLRVLSENPAGVPLPSAAKSQLEMHLKQLAARYAEIKQNSAE